MTDQPDPPSPEPIGEFALAGRIYLRMSPESANGALMYIQVEMAQSFMDQLWDQGVRPKEFDRGAVLRSAIIARPSFGKPK
jgi:hypothetical protein